MQDQDLMRYTLDFVLFARQHRNSTLSWRLPERCRISFVRARTNAGCVPGLHKLWRHPFWIAGQQGDDAFHVFDTWNVPPDFIQRRSNLKVEADSPHQNSSVEPGWMSNQKRQRNCAPEGITNDGDPFYS